ncbi:MAG TPA: c-type cytochrome [Burkholderiaceae bacterium]|nr:c-type cytochrome [Burkholderiaceae bacterium]
MKRALISTVLLASLSFLAQAQGAKPGDPKEGEKKAAMCIGCHGIKGYQASFPEVHKVPMISGQGGKYIAAALSAYKKGERKHPTMRGIAVSLTDQDIADLSAFYETHGGQAAAVPEQAPAAKADVAKLFEKGACASCHGANFNKPIDGSYPKIAGQHADYLYVALKAYKTEGNANVGRGNPIMAGMAKQFSNAELRAMAEYLAALPGELRTIKEASFR